MTLVLELVKIFGPILLGWLQKWFENRAKEVSEQLPAIDSYATRMDAQTALLRKMLDSLPHMAFARRGLIRAMLKNPKGIPPEQLEHVKGEAERALME